MGKSSFSRREEERDREHKGTAGRGIMGCAITVASVALGVTLYWWLTQKYDLVRLFTQSVTVPPVVVHIVGAIIIIVVVQAAFTMFTGVIWRLIGRDKKDAEKMQELADNWDELNY